MRRCLHELRCVRQIEIDQLPAVVTDRVIVTISFAIVAAGAVAKIYLVNQTCILQVAQRVVNGCVADTGQAPPGRLKDVAGGRVIIPLLYDLKNRLSLRRQLWCLLRCLQDGFRLILNLRFVNRSMGASLECGGLAPLSYKSANKLAHSKVVRLTNLRFRISLNLL